MAQYYEPPLRVTVNRGSGGTTTLRHEKRRNVLYATRVEDRFGNHVVYNYSNTATQPARLDSIVASDGRRLNISYVSGRVSKVEAIASDAANQTWLYEYASAPDSQMSLARVILPGDTPQAPNRWTLELAQLSRAKIQQWSAAGEPSRNCLLNWGWSSLNGPNQFTGRMTHPSGAVGDFQFKIMTHGRSWVPVSCSLGTSVPPPGGMRNTDDDVNRWTISYESLTLTQKTISGPGLSPGTWAYEYQPNTSAAPFLPGQTMANPVCPFMVDCSIPQCNDDSCAKSAVTTVRAPDGRWERYWHGNTYLYNEGKLLKVERGGYLSGGAEEVLQRTIHSYDLSLQDAAYPARYGDSALDPGNAFPSMYHRPLLQSVVQQQGINFTRAVNAFDAFAQPVAQTRSSTLPGNPLRKETIQRENNLAKWVLGQVKAVACVLPTAPAPASCGAGIVMSETTYDTLARPTLFKSFGKVVQTLTYNADGTVATVKDGNNHVTTLSAWKRGIPQSIRYPATPESPTGATQSAVVNDHGWLTRVTDENGFATNYAHDAMGRIASIAYPTGDTTSWNATTQAFQQVMASEYGIPAGHWRQTISTGNARKVTYFDGRWRPLLTREYDTGNEAGTQRFQRFAYDHEGRSTFASYPATASNLSTGIWSGYDALGRPTSVSQDSELGLLTTLTAYETGFQTRVTSPKLQQTVTRYLAWDEPTTGLPVYMGHPEGAHTHITRDVFGKPTLLRRSNSSSPTGGTVAVNRSYVYDAYQQLCKQVEPETGATVMAYDAAGNLQWSASGQALPSTTACNTANVPTSERVLRAYDARNRLTDLQFPGGNGSQTWSHTPDGLPASVVTWNDGGNSWVTNSYSYNRRRLMTGESQTISDGYDTWSFGYSFNANGHLASLVYPAGLTIDYAPNALGQPTRAGNFATNVSYHPSGAVKQFTYGNGLVFTMAQNDRQLPDRIRSALGSLVVHDESMDYDHNGNVAAISDALPSQRGDRTMTYDGLDRLTATDSPMFAGGVLYAYDVLDNLKRVKAPGRDHTYHYDANNRLHNVTNTVGGGAVSGLGYDMRGNLANKGGQAYVFDHGNRLRSATGLESYRYDAEGRRIKATTPASAAIYSVYGKGGQLLFQRDERVSFRFQYVYLGSQLIGLRRRPIGDSTETLMYYHTDALGSNVAITNPAQQVIQRSEYEPYGRVLNRATNNRPGFTGHLEDAATGLTYMQQRYYDPQIGLFLSVDPVTAYSSPVAMFNRYRYANSNPYRFYDPDGRCTGSRIKNGDGTCASTGEFTTQASSARSLDTRSVDKVFTHSSTSDHGGGQRTSFPSQTRSELRRFLGTQVGGAIGRHSVGSGQKINMVQILPDAPFDPTYSGGFSPDQGGNYVSYSLDVAGFLANSGYPQELAGATLGVLLAHEIGHTPLAASALGYGVHDGSDPGEFNAVRYLENPYRSAIGLPLRTHYSGMKVPGPIIVEP